MNVLSGWSGVVTGRAAATIFYNLRQRHPTLELPLIDYDLVLLFQPMLMVGISIGVSLNVVLSEWMITTLLIIVLTGNTFLSCNLPRSQLDNFLMYDITAGPTTKSFFKAVETWKEETITKKVVFGFCLFLD